MAFSRKTDPEYMSLLGQDPSLVKIVDPFVSSRNTVPTHIPTVKQLIEVVLPFFQKKGLFNVDVSTTPEQISQAA